MTNNRGLNQLIMGLEKSDSTLTISHISADTPAEYLLHLDTHFLRDLYKVEEEVLRSRIAIDHERRTIGFHMGLITTCPFERYGFALDALNSDAMYNPTRAVRAYLGLSDDDEETDIILRTTWVLPLATIWTGSGQLRRNAGPLLRRLLTQFCSESFEIAVDFAAEIEELAEN